MSMNIEQPILSKAIIRGNVHYYAYENAIELVDICQRNRLPILGIDSLIVTETKTQPFMEHSIDLSDSQNSYKDAKAFLDLKKNLGFVFEVVY
jgi:hypothetical protein